MKTEDEIRADNSDALNAIKNTVATLLTAGVDAVSVAAACASIIGHIMGALKEQDAEQAKNLIGILIEVEEKKMRDRRGEMK